jgi:hypothetical protein
LVPLATQAAVVPASTRFCAYRRGHFNTCGNDRNRASHVGHGRDDNGIKWDADLVPRQRRNEMTTISESLPKGITFSNPLTIKRYNGGH